MDGIAKISDFIPEADGVSTLQKALKGFAIPSTSLYWHEVPITYPGVG
jgi:hypothetical protein